MNLPRFEPAVPLVCLLLCLMIFTLLPLEERQVKALTARKGWFTLCQDFYQSGAGKLLGELQRDKNLRLRLLPEKNETDYLISSPCNEGLINTLSKQWNKSSLPVIYWQGPVVRRGVANESRGRWLDHRGQSLAKQGLQSYIETTAPCRIIISKCSIEDDCVKAKLELRFSGKVIHSQDVLGSTEQLRWFIRPPAKSWALWLPLALFLAASLLTFGCYQKYFRGQDNLFAEFWMALACLAGAALAAFFVNNVYWFNRTGARIHQPTNVFIFVDRNSECYYPSSFKEEASCGPRFLTRIVCDEIGSRLSGERGTIEVPFWSWFWSAQWLEAIYEGKNYELNQRFRCLLHFLSGREASDNNPLIVPPSGSATYMTKGLYRSTSKKGQFNRESRLILAAQEVEKILGKSSNKGGQPVALLFTSQCSPYDKNLRHFLENLHALPSHRAARVFTVFLPTIPRTGEYGLRHYEDGKLLFAALSANVVVQTNDKSYDLKKCYQQLKKSFGKSMPPSANLAKIVEHPVFSLPNLSSNNRPLWDKPQNLLELREKRLSLVGSEKETRQQGRQIAARFLEFANPDSSKSQRKDESVHVLSSNRWAASLFLLLSLSSALVYVNVGEEYNLAFRDAFRQNWALWLWQGAYLLFSALLLIFALFILFWRRADSLVFAFPGSAKNCLVAAITLWLALFAQPFFVFRLWLSSRLLSRKKAIILSSLLVFSLALLVLFINEQEWSSAMRFFLSLLAIAGPTLVLLLPWRHLASTAPRGSAREQNMDLMDFIRGTQLPWYATPWWSSFIKWLLALSLAIQLYYPIKADGSLADPLLTIGGMPTMSWIWGVVGCCLLLMALYRLQQEH